MLFRSGHNVFNVILVDDDDSGDDENNRSKRRVIPKFLPPSSMDNSDSTTDVDNSDSTTDGDDEEDSPARGLIFTSPFWGHSRGLQGCWLGPRVCRGLRGGSVDA